MTHTISDEVFKQLPKEARDLICPQEGEWHPPGGDWHVYFTGEIGEFDQPLKLVSMFGMERPTKALAEKHLDRLWLFNRIAAYVDQYAPDYEPDWGHEDAPKYKVEYDHYDKRYFLASSNCISGVCDIYMPKHIAEQLLADIESGRFKTERG